MGTAYVLMIDDDDSAEIETFGSEVERDDRLWGYAFERVSVEGVDTMEAFKDAFDDDVANAMARTGAGWKTDDFRPPVDAASMTDEELEACIEEAATRRAQRPAM